jgi:hypothetical protein
MRIQAAALLLVLVAATNQAYANCGTTTARQLATRDFDSLLKNFDASDSKTRRDLEDIIASLGDLSEVAEATQPRFKSHKRLSVNASTLSAAYTATVYRVNATSSKMGAIQVSVETKPNALCSVLAVHLDIGAR